MAVKQSSKQEPPIVEGGTSIGGGVTDRSGSSRMGASDVSSAVKQDLKKHTSGQVQRNKKRSRTKSDRSESLSDIDDAEVAGYLNSKEEVNLKKMIWEAMNRQHVKVKKQKLDSQKTKATSAKKAVKTNEKLNHPKRSSRINYDALRNLSDDLEEDSGIAHSADLDLDSCRNDNLEYENITTPKMQFPEEGDDDEDEDQQQITYDEEDDGIFRHPNDALSYGCEDEYYEDDENFDFE